MKTKNLVILSALTFVFFALMSMGMPQAQKKPAPWAVPAKYKSMKNPVAKTDKEMQTVGKNLYNKHCRTCHGNTGLGDGPRAKGLKTFAGDFSSAAFHAQSDGDLFYKSLIGRDEMPNYEKKIPEADDMWAIVNYMRTFKK